MKKYILIVMSCLLALFAVGCQNEAKVENLPLTEVVIDAKTYNHAEHPLYISKDTDIIIKNMNPEDLFSLRTANSGRGRSLSSIAATENDDVFVVNDGSYITSGSKGSVTMKGSDIGIADTGKFSLLKMKNNTSYTSDMKIEGSDNVNDPDFVYYDFNGDKVYEEYYHITRDQLVSMLGTEDLSSVIITSALWGNGGGSTYYGLVNVKEDGSIEYYNNSHSVLDLSKCTHIDVINSMTLYGCNTPWSQELFLFDAKNLESSGTLKEGVTPLYIPESIDPMVLEINYNFENLYMSDGVNLRTATNGDSYSFPLTLSDVKDEDGIRKIKLYLGSISEPLLADLKIKVEDNGTITESDSFIVQKATDLEIAQFKKSCIKINPDAKETILATPLNAGSSFNGEFKFVTTTGTNDVSKLNQYKITLEARHKVDGEDFSKWPFAIGDMTVDFKTQHYDHKGDSNNTLFGPVAVFYVNGNDYLDLMKVNINSSQDVYVSYKIEKLDEPIYSDVFTACFLYLDNTYSIQSWLNLSYGNKYTLPKSLEGVEGVPKYEYDIPFDGKEPFEKQGGNNVKIEAASMCFKVVSE